MKYPLLTSILGSMFAGFLLTPAHAAVMLSGNLTQEYALNPGSTATGTLELKNTGDTPAEVKIYQEDIKIKNDGSTEYTPGNGSHMRSNAAWINIGTDHLILPPRTNQSIPYSIHVPTGHLQGSYWSTLMLEPISANSRESQLANTSTDKPILTIHQKMRYAVQVITNIGNQGAANLVFDSPSMLKDKAGGRYLGFGIRNTGTRRSRPKVWLDVFSRNGDSIGRFPAETHGLYVNEREYFTARLGNLQPGTYKALLAAEDNHNGQMFGSDVNLTIQP
jgi:hypothetical protein